jgi:outer membrane protein assembly factor BamB
MSDSWPGWRGRERTGVVNDATWPDSIEGDHLELLWKVPLGKSYSGPIVWGDSVIVTESIDDGEQVQALNRGDGNLLWENRWPGSMSVPFFAASNGSWIRSTPATDGTRIYAGGMRDVLACLDFKTGEKIYSLDFVDQFKSPLPAFGQVCSPLIDGERLYLQSGGGLLCMDRASGKVIWRTMVENDGMMSSAFSSPLIGTLHGKRQLIVQTRGELCGVDLESGQPFWRVKIATFRGMNILTPTVWNDCVFTSAYGGKSLMFELIPKSNADWEVKERWTAKAEGYMSSPLLIDDQLYLYLRNQRLVCLDAATGQERWRSRPYGKYWSMVTNGNKILALDEQGKLFLVEPNLAEFTLLGERKISDQDCWAHLAIVDQQLFIRDLTGLSVYRWS